MERLGVIGGGMMGSAIIQGVLHNGLLQPERIGVVEINPERAETLRSTLGVRLFGSLKELAEENRVLLIAVKPQTMEKVCSELAPVIGPAHLVLSIVAGVTVTSLERLLPKARVVRVMPNTPARLNRGISAYATGSGIGPEDCKLTEAILGAVGKVVRVTDDQMDAVTATSGSGPAYLFRFAEAMIDAAVMLGLNHTQARVLVAETLAGAGEMLSQTGSEPALLRHEVTSPGGTTAAALYELEKGALSGIVIQAMEAAAKRSSQLGTLMEKK